MTHLPRNPFCQACVNAKFRHKPRWRESKQRDDEAPTIFGEEVTADHVYVDKSKGLDATVNTLGFAKGSSTPGIPQSNRVIKNQVLLTLNGAKIVLEQAGLPACFWPRAVRHWNHSSHVQSFGGELSPWEKRHGSAFGGPAALLSLLVRR